MAPPSRIAFVDVETNGLSPTEHRIAEIGLVLVDGERVERWTTLVKGGSDARLASDAWKAVPAFGDVAPELARRLAGRLFVAHNARFDYAFLRAEFERVSMAFEAPVVCSVMMSRKLRPDLARHDLDSLAAHHGLRVEERHRALPDADLVWQWWCGLSREFPEDVIARAIDELLAGPVLPSALDPALIASLPSAPGAYVLHGAGGIALAIGAAINLRGHAIDYFRVDRATPRALEHAHRVADITYRRTRGMIGARLHAASLMRVHWPQRVIPDVSWRLAPDVVPCVDVIALDDCRAPDHGESFGLFPSERMARNALARLASRRGLCHAMLGLEGDCGACAYGGCGTVIARKKHLLRVYDTVRPLRVEAWPYPWAIGIRERGDLHVVDGWQFLGTARNEEEAHELAATRRAGFDRRVYKLLRSELPRIPRDRIVDFSASRREAASPRDAAATSLRS